MPNPVVVFIAPEQFPSGCAPRVRVGVDAAGHIEPIAPDRPYRLVILRDTDDLEGLAFWTEPQEPLVGIEHRSRPFKHIEALSKVAAAPYRQVITFNHADTDPLFPLLVSLFSVPLAAGAVDEILRQVEAQDLLGGLLTVVMNEQIGMLGGQKVPLRDLRGIARTIAVRAESNGRDLIFQEILRDLA